jgi:hypothetical protein
MAMRRTSAGRRRGIDWRWMFVSSLCLLFFLLSLSAWLANIAAFRARVWVETWDNLVTTSLAKSRTYRPDDADWEEARWHALWATRLAPFNADFRETLARVYIAKQFDIPDGDAALLPMLTLAEEQYRKAIALRPNWPYGYIGLAYVLRREVRLDASYEQSMRDAVHYGPWEPMVLTSVVSLNIDVLHRLSPSTRTFVLQTLRRGQAWTQDSEGLPIPYGDQIWHVVTSRRKDMLVCSWLRLDTPLLRQRCLSPVPAESMRRSTS